MVLPRDHRRSVVTTENNTKAWLGIKQKQKFTEFHCMHFSPPPWRGGFFMDCGAKSWCFFGKGKIVKNFYYFTDSKKRPPYAWRPLCYSLCVVNRLKLFHVSNQRSYDFCAFCSCQFVVWGEAAV